MVKNKVFFDRSSGLIIWFSSVILVAILKKQFLPVNSL